MPIQVDIIPTPMRDGWALNCEDGIVFADAVLRAELKARHPAVVERIEARRNREESGPLSHRSQHDSDANRILGGQTRPIAEIARPQSTEMFQCLPTDAAPLNQTA